MQVLLRTLMLLGAAMSAAHAEQSLAPDEVTLARYSTAAALPAKGDDDPLRVIAHIQFPRSDVTTVGQAIRYLLVRTGYALVDNAQFDPAVVHVLSRPLPESNRELGAYRVDAMLGVLMGKAFVLRVNHLQRSVSFAPATSAVADSKKGPQ
ncbi:MAG: hypothetical protein H7315_15275 [Herminiimonas sp.]|nr:hypothetical protein [Herminiimonas sp.]